MFHATQYSIRPATIADTDALQQIAGLDSRRPLTLPVLVGELDGTVAAAIGVSDGRVVADPFRRTGHLVSNLRVRAAGERAARTTPSLRRRILAAVPARLRPSSA